MEELEYSPPSVGGAGSAAAPGGADPRVPEQMEGDEEKDVVGNLIRTLNDETTTRITIAAHGSYSEKPSSYTCDSYVIETSLYGEIFYVIKIKYIDLFYLADELELKYDKEKRDGIHIKVMIRLIINFMSKKSGYPKLIK
jgi:hypothetical protein